VTPKLVDTLPGPIHSIHASTKEGEKATERVRENWNSTRSNRADQYQKTERWRERVCASVSCKPQPQRGRETKREGEA